MLAAAATAASVPPAAVEGRVVVQWTLASVGSETVVRERGMLTYAVGGRMMGERARRAWSAASFPSGYAETRLPAPAYVPARLVQATMTRTLAAPCADGGSANLTTTVASIADPHAVLTHDESLVLQVLRHRGAAALAPYSRVRRDGAGIVVGSTVWRSLGRVRTETSGTRCPETVVTTPPIADLGELLPGGVLHSWSLDERPFAATVRPDGSVVIRGTRHASDTSRDERTTVRVDVDLTLRGALQGMDAQCTWPTPRELAGAATVAQALAIVHRAGLVATFGGSHRNASVRPGGYWISTGSPFWRCGLPARGFLVRA